MLQIIAPHDGFLILERLCVVPCVLLAIGAGAKVIEFPGSNKKPAGRSQRARQIVGQIVVRRQVSMSLPAQ